MLSILILFCIFIIPSTHCLFGIDINYKKLKNIKDNNLTRYGAAALPFFTVAGLYYFLDTKRQQKIVKKSPFFHKVKLAKKQEKEIKLSFLIKNPETDDFINVINKEFPLYRTDDSPNIGLVKSSNICNFIRNTIASKKDQAPSIEFSLSQGLIPEDDYCFFDADFIAGITIFTLVFKNTLQR